MFVSEECTVSIGLAVDTPSILDKNSEFPGLGESAGAKIEEKGSPRKIVWRGDRALAWMPPRETPGKHGVLPGQAGGVRLCLELRQLILQLVLGGGTSSRVCWQPSAALGKGQHGIHLNLLPHTAFGQQGETHDRQRRDCHCEADLQ